MVNSFDCSALISTRLFINILYVQKQKHTKNPQTTFSRNRKLFEHSLSLFAMVLMIFDLCFLPFFSKSYLVLSDLAFERLCCLMVGDESYFFHYDRLREKLANDISSVFEKLVFVDIDAGLACPQVR